MVRTLGRRPLLKILCMAGVLAASAAAPAKIDLVTIPASDSTQLTIYNSEDLTLVRETRTLSFSEGLNEIQFSWANTLIDPTSLHVEVPAGKGLLVEDTIYPANTRDLAVWSIQAEAETSAPVEITYFISGLSWSSDYTIRTNEQETEFQLQQNVTVRNNSGEGFHNARTRVVVGEVNLIDLIAQLAQRGMVDDPRFRQDVARKMVGGLEMAAGRPMAMAESLSFADGRAAKEIAQKAVSEYYLLSVEGEETIENGWGKRLPNPVVPGIKFDLSYEIDPNKYGGEVVKFYKLRNDADHELGEAPMPAGQFYVFGDDGRGGMRFHGSTHHKYVPVGEKVELNLGSDGLVLYEERTMSVARRNFDFDSSGNITGHEEVREMELEIRNSHDRAVPVKLTHYLYGDWEFDTVSDDYEKVDSNTVRWEFDAPARDKKVITYRVITRNGTLARSNQ